MNRLAPLAFLCLLGLLSHGGSHGQTIDPHLAPPPNGNWSDWRPLIPIRQALDSGNLLLARERFDTLQRHQHLMPSLGGIALDWLGLRILYAEGEWNEALEGSQRLLLMLDTTPRYSDVRAFIEGGYGSLLLAHGDHALAQEHLENARDLYLERNDTLGVIYAISQLASNVLALGDAQQAQRYMRRCERYAPLRPDTRYGVRMLLTNGQISHAQGYEKEAEAQLQLAATQAARLGQRLDWASAKCELLQLYTERQDRKAAQILYDELWSTLAADDYISSLSGYNKAIGDYYYYIERQAQLAYIYYLNAMQDALQQGNMTMVAKLRWSLGMLRIRDGDLSAAYAMLRESQVAEDSLRKLRQATLFRTSNEEILTAAQEAEEELRSAQEKITIPSRLVSDPVIYIMLGVSLFYAISFVLERRRIVRQEYTGRAGLLRQEQAFKRQQTALDEVNVALNNMLVQGVRQESAKEQLHNKLLSQSMVFTESMEYGHAIQGAFTLREVDGLHYRDSFLLHLPHELIGGDMCWQVNRGGQDVIVLADCSGQGVSGAALALLFHQMLNRVVIEQGEREPARVIQEVDKLLFTLFKGTEEEFRKRVDVTLSVLTITPREGSALFAGVGQHLLFAHPEQPIVRLRGNPGSVGESLMHFQNVEQHTIGVVAGMMFYLASDGISNQLNARNERFGAKRLIETLQPVLQKPLVRQRDAILQALREFRAGQDQTDDMTLFALRIPGASAIARDKSA